MLSSSRQDAGRVLEWCRLRWRIENWHGVRKTGCKAEWLGHPAGERIERVVTIRPVIVWPLTAMTLLGHDTPELPPETLLSDIEILALRDFAYRRNLVQPDTLGRAVLTMAILGGYGNYKRKQYAEPDHQIIWGGYTKLSNYVEAYEQALDLEKCSRLYKRMLPDKTCG